jgi:hypothetical protein
MKAARFFETSEEEAYYPTRSENPKCHHLSNHPRKPSNQRPLVYWDRNQIKASGLP